jgi:hypothetical protein
MKCLVFEPVECCGDIDLGICLGEDSTSVAVDWADSVAVFTRRTAAVSRWQRQAGDGRYLTGRSGRVMPGPRS